MASTLCIEPIVGDWYRSHGQLFEVIAVDDDDGIVEVQHADGDLEEIDLDDWFVRCRARSLHTAEAPEDSALSTDRSDGEDAGIVPSSIDEINGLRADAMSGLDLFE